MIEEAVKQPPAPVQKELEELYVNLAMTVIRHAVADYERTLVQLFFQPNMEKKARLRICKAELEAFFHSEGYALLTDIDADLIIRQAQRNAISTAKQRIRRKHQKKLAELEGKRGATV